jgi:hypothetical protein
VFKQLFRGLLILIVVAGLVWFFAPRILNNAANTTLSSANSSLAQGLAQFIPATLTTQKKSGGDLQVQLNGLDANTTYEVTLDQGSCGTVSKDLGHATSDKNGNFSGVFTLASFDSKQTWFLDVHQAVASGVSIACGQLQTSQAASSQIINAAENGPGVFSGVSSTPTPDPSQSTSPQVTPTATQGLPNVPDTGADPGTDQNYDNGQYPRKY